MHGDAGGESKNGEKKGSTHHFPYRIATAMFARQNDSCSRPQLRHRAAVILACEHGGGDSIRKMMRRTFLLTVLALAAGIAVHAATASLRIVPTVRDDSVIVSVELADAYTDEVRDAIASGLRTTFTYDLELKMDVPAWADRTVATATVAMSDHYDTLTRVHNLARSVDG